MPNPIQRHLRRAGRRLAIHLPGSARRSFLILGVLTALGFPKTVGAVDPADLASQYAAAERAAAAGRSAESVALTTSLLATDPEFAAAYYLRGREQFRLGQFAASLADFDAYLARVPERRSSLWERGITCYYAEQYQAGADQFLAYQTFDNRDVENAVWHVLCLSRIRGWRAAQRALMPVKHDARVPMMTLYDLFRGQASPEDVLKAAEQPASTEAHQNRQRFYAHLYLGLYFEANQRPDLARQHLTQAAHDHRIDHYMWDVANVHAKRLTRPTP